jgi:hypothetical protein
MQFSLGNAFGIACSVLFFVGAVYYYLDTFYNNQVTYAYEWLLYVLGQGKNPSLLRRERRQQAAVVSLMIYLVFMVNSLQEEYYLL